MAESFEDVLLRIERTLLRAPSVKSWLAALDAVLALDDADQIAKALARMPKPSMGTAAGRAMVGALDAAIAVASRLIHPAPSGAKKAGKLAAKTRFSFGFSPELLAIISGFDPAAKKRIAEALKVAKAGGDVDAILAPVRAAKNHATRTVTTVVNQAANEATRHVATEEGLPVVWVAERNGCVRCLKYSGVVAKVGEDFPGGLTYASAGAAHPSLKTPPLHPHCRCHLEPLKDQSYADALRREADRSVLRGFALESESRSARIDAAKTLLSDGVDAPKSVIKFAERSIKKGNFDTTLRKPPATGHDFTP